MKEISLKNLKEYMEEPKFQFFDDDGTEINPDLVRKPSLCISCIHDEDPSQEVLCILNRHDQQGEDNFQCGAYEPKVVWNLNGREFLSLHDK